MEEWVGMWAKMVRQESNQADCQKSRALGPGPRARAPWSQLITTTISVAISAQASSDSTADASTDSTADASHVAHPPVLLLLPPLRPGRGAAADAGGASNAGGAGAILFSHAGAGVDAVDADGTRRPRHRADTDARYASTHPRHRRQYQRPRHAPQGVARSGGGGDDGGGPAGHSPPFATGGGLIRFGSGEPWMAHCFDQRVSPRPTALDVFRRQGHPAAVRAYYRQWLITPQKTNQIIRTDG